MSIDFDIKRNEPNPEIGLRNRLETDSTLDPRSLGLAGVRILVDRALLAIDGFGREQMESAGSSFRELIERREEATAVLARIAEFDGDRPTRQRQRSAAIRLLGHLKSADQTELLTQIARNESEPVPHRVAALDALAQLGDQQTLPVASELQETSDERIQEAAIRLVGRLGGPEDLEQLRRLLDENESNERGPTLHDARVRAAASISVRLAIPVNLPSLVHQHSSRRRPTSTRPTA